MSLLCTVLIPAKSPGRAKSRLTGFEAEHHRRLVRAFLLDTLEAVVRAAGVRQAYVVSNDPHTREEVAQLGVAALADHGAGDLNLALTHAATEVGEPGPVVALLGDLPCLQSESLARVLTATTAPGHFVADEHGTGTTLLVASKLEHFRPCFGPGSAQAHLAAGYRPLTQVPAGLRLDVDTLADLDRARQLGVGRHTSAALADST